MLPEWHNARSAYGPHLSRWLHRRFGDSVDVQFHDGRLFRRWVDEDALLSIKTVDEILTRLEVPLWEPPPTIWRWAGIRTSRCNRGAAELAGRMWTDGATRGEIRIRTGRTSAWVYDVTAPIERPAPPKLRVVGSYPEEAAGGPPAKAPAAELEDAA